MKNVQIIQPEDTARRIAAYNKQRTKEEVAYEEEHGHPKDWQKYYQYVYR